MYLFGYEKVYNRVMGMLKGLGGIIKLLLEILKVFK